MIFQEPRLEDMDKRVVDHLRKQRERLRHATSSSTHRWQGTLRKYSFARAVQGSNSIEGYNATMDEAMAAIEQEPPLDERTETWMAITGYRSALTYIMQAAEDPYFEMTKQFLKSLHFMMTSHDMKASPGRWRPSSIRVIREPQGIVVYEGPDVEQIDSLVQELVMYLSDDTDGSVIVKAAMAHLNLTMIHPFRDGNGRMARALQTLVLAREGIVDPLFSSIEEWLGRNTDDYYRILAEVGQGKWNPSNDALPWIRFCLTAHYQQANTLIRRIDEYEAVYEQVNAMVERDGLNDRMTLPLFNAALGIRITNARYQEETGQSAYVATRDLKLLADRNLIEPHGEKRGRYYTGGEQLKTMRNRARREKTFSSPYDLPNVNPSPRFPGI